MDWQTIEYSQIQSLDIFDYQNGFAPSTPPQQVWTGSQKMRILFYDGDLELSDLIFDTNRFLSPEADMLVVDGDLTLKGDLDVRQLDVGTPGYLVVSGDLKAENIFLTQQFELIIRGDLDVSGILLAEHGSSGGIMIGGQHTAPVTVLVDFPLRARDLAGTVFVQNRHPYYDPEAIFAGMEAARYVAVEEDVEYGQFWLLSLPEGKSQEDIETSEEFAGYSILTDAALSDYHGTGGTLTPKEILQEYGLAALRY